MSQLPADCLNEIFEYLEDDKVTLHSCLLVNHSWCEIAVRILWRSALNYDAMSFSTLIACLPNESKEILHENGIIISTPTSKPPLFNYAAFCKVISINQVNYIIGQLLRKFISSYSNFIDKKHILEQEIFKLFMKQISSLKRLSVNYNILYVPQLVFTSYPGARDCLKNLSVLDCHSNIYSEFFYQLSQICHNIQSLIITFSDVISNGLTDLISVQKNLKCLEMVQYDHCKNLTNTIPSLAKQSDTLTKLILDGKGWRGSYLPLFSFISKFINLQELRLSFYYNYAFEDFKSLQHVTFPQLQILGFRYSLPSYELLIKFLENNGKGLKEFYVGEFLGIFDDSLNLAIAKFCPNLRRVSSGFESSKLETLKIVFNSCQYLESVKIWCGGIFLTEKEALEMFVKYSPKSIHELALCHIYREQSVLLTEELESFFVSWTNRIPQKSLSLVIVNYDAVSLDTNDKNMEVIEKYIKLGVIKKFKVTDFNDKVYSDANLTT